MTKIMLVEDDNNLREIYGARLMAEGYQIVSAADGEEALALAVKEKPELIVADVMMPKISGFDMLDILRTTPETKNTKVIIMTALSQPEDRARGESLGADKYLVKSQVTLEDVVAAVHEILGDVEGTQSAPANTNTPVANNTAAPETQQQPAASPQMPPQDTSEQPQPSTDNDQTGTDDEPPKVEGASDAPEPASKKKKTIQPINDLSHEKEDFLKMVAEEEAREKQSTPGTAVGPTDDALEQQTKMAETMAEEKKQMEEDVKKMVNDGTIDDEASKPPVKPDNSQQSGAPSHDDGPGPGVDMSATAPQTPPQPPVSSAPQEPPKPPSEPTQPASPEPSAPVPPAEVATPTAPEASASPADTPEPGSSVQPERVIEHALDGNSSEVSEVSSAVEGAMNVGGEAQEQTPAEASGQPPAAPNTDSEQASETSQRPAEEVKPEENSQGPHPNDVAL